LILSTLLGKEGSYLALVSAIPATLGGTILLLYTILAVGGVRSSTVPVPLTPQRSLLWCGAGVLAILSTLTIEASVVATSWTLSLVTLPGVPLAADLAVGIRPLPSESMSGPGASGAQLAR
jgi:hypothetical protein